MGRIDFVSIIICLLAVIGLYFLLSKLIGGLVGRRYTVGIRAEEYEDGYEVLCAWHAVQMMALTSKDAEGLPVVLFDGPINMRTVRLLRDEGIPIYHKIGE
ncbi:MAG: hypothetical protein IKC43_04305 [Clostridia bacterium]|nr:hypothetical protein [Clostridia bacterium]MBR6795263.1 hypothetical protein [Clostridia bacterium]